MMLVKVLAALLYPRAEQGEQLFPLADVDGALAQLITALTAARGNIINGILALGLDAGEWFNEFRFALPSSPSYLDRKKDAARKRLGKAADIWEVA